MSDKVDPLPADKAKWLADAERHILEILVQKYGAVRLDHTEADLLLCQRLIDDHVFNARQTLELQCLGVVLGNVLDTQTTMRWAVVTNNYGTRLALHDPKIGFTLYPVEMISQRVEDGRTVIMPQLYQTFVHDLGLTKR